MIDHFQYNIGVPAEELAKYYPGGYHPIHLGDILDRGRYRILDKLGLGSFSTVWLARDEVNDKNVSIKVVVSEQLRKHYRELEVLEAIKQNGDPAHPGHKYVSHLVDSFYLEGPNGRHLYIHLGNVLFRLSNPNRTPTVDDLRIGKVSRKDGSASEKGVPEYLVEPPEYTFDKSELLDEVQLVDFGESFFISNPPKSICTPTSLHPPELVFRHSLTGAVDTWNLGCTTYELITGRTLFEAGFNDRELVPQFQKVLGGVPEQWIQEGLKAGVLTEEPDESAADGFLPLEEEIQASYINGYNKETLDLDVEDLAVLGSYLRRMCVVEPIKRAKLAELMLHRWVQADNGT